MRKQIEMCACGNEPIFIQKRGLGRRCYNWIWRNGGLPSIPIKSREARKKTLTRNLIKKYGFGIICDFDDLNHRPFWNLVDVGNKHGFSRERARQIYTLLCNKPFTPVQMRKNKKTRGDDIACLHNPLRKIAEYKKGSSHRAGAKIEQLFIDKCEKRGIKVVIPCTRIIDLKINGYNVEVKSRGLTNVNTNSFQFPIHPNQYEKADFFACYHKTEAVFFIVPRDAVRISKRSRGICYSICISEKKTTNRNAKNYYWQYRNAWHQLGG